MSISIGKHQLLTEAKPNQMTERSLKTCFNSLINIHKLPHPWTGWKPWISSVFSAVM